MQLIVLLFISIIMTFSVIQPLIKIYSQLEDNTDNYKDLDTKEYDNYLWTSLLNLFDYSKDIMKNLRAEIIGLFFAYKAEIIDLWFAYYSFFDKEDKTANTIPSQLKSGDKIALVMPTFTAAAYNFDKYHSFYAFYKKYAKTDANEFVTTDLDLLTEKVPSLREALFKYKYNGLEILANRISSSSPNIETTFLTDTDVHNGLVFDNSHQNIYDVIILGHQEYVTKAEYYNFKKFVENGGILILLNANMLYAEVAYNPIDEEITLVQGHSWAFDGEKAWPSVSERWKTETSEWVGSNFFECGKGCPIDFKNNPFSYVQREEQNITNPNVNILLDYEAQSKYNVRVAAYELEYGKGKVISFGIFGDDIINNKEFLRFFDEMFFSHVSAV
jgi:hypothetical protein